VIILRFARRVAVAWTLQVSLAIRLHFEMPVVDRPDLLQTTEVEPHFEIARDGRRDLQVKAGESQSSVLHLAVQSFGLSLIRCSSHALLSARTSLNYFALGAFATGNLVRRM